MPAADRDACDPKLSTLKHDPSTPDPDFSPLTPYTEPQTPTSTNLILKPSTQRHKSTRAPKSEHALFPIEHPPADRDHEVGPFHTELGPKPLTIHPTP